MTFDAPVVLWVTPLVALMVGGIAVWARSARIARARRWSLSLAREARGFGRWSPVMMTAITGLAMAALAGPRWGTRVVRTEEKGLNLVIAVDISRSMLAEDAAPSRLERVQRQARRLVQDLQGDRIGLVAFAQRSFVLSPLTVDQNALLLLIDALDPSLVSQGGTNLTDVIRLSHDLLLSGDQVADRVLVVFTDGETHEETGFVEAAEALRRGGIHLIMVAEGGPDPVTIPVRDAEGVFIGYQRDPTNEIVRTRRRDDHINAMADAAQGVVVAAEHGNQAGAIRDLVDAYKRSPQATTMAAQDLSRAWIPVIVAVLLLLAHTFTRRSMALASLAFIVMTGSAGAQAPKNPADETWELGEARAAARMYLLQALNGEGGDTTWFNAGAAAVAARDTALANEALRRAARSLDPDVRFRALYNLGLLHLRLGMADTANAQSLLSEALLAFREALLLHPGDRGTKWNLELALRALPPPPSGGPLPPQTPPDDQPPSPDSSSGGLTRAQAEQILNSIAEAERRTRLDQNRQRGDLRETRGRKEW